MKGCFNPQFIGNMTKKENFAYKWQKIWITIKQYYEYILRLYLPVYETNFNLI